MRHPWVYITFIVLVFSGMLISSRLGGSANTEWYKSLYKPSFTPPGYVFGIVWPVLYTLIAIVGARLFLLHHDQKILCLTLWGIQLFVNFLFAWMFFGLQSPILGFVNVVVLWFLIIILMIKLFSVERVSFFLLIPYITWVSLALAISFSIMMHPFE